MFIKYTYVTVHALKACNFGDTLCTNFNMRIISYVYLIPFCVFVNCITFTHLLRLYKPNESHKKNRTVVRHSQL